MRRSYASPPGARVPCVAGVARLARVCRAGVMVLSLMGITSWGCSAPMWAQSHAPIAMIAAQAEPHTSTQGEPRIWLVRGLAIAEQESEARWRVREAAVTALLPAVRSDLAALRRKLGGSQWEVTVAISTEVLDESCETHEARDAGVKWHLLRATVRVDISQLRDRLATQLGMTDPRPAK